MYKTQIIDTSSAKRHACESYQEGDWIVYKCPKCDYEMRQNWRSGEMQVKNSKKEIHHSGNFVPPEFMARLLNMN